MPLQKFRKIPVYYSASFVKRLSSVFFVALLQKMCIVCSLAFVFVRERHVSAKTFSAPCHVSILSVRVHGIVSHKLLDNKFIAQPY